MALYLRHEWAPSSPAAPPRRLEDVAAALHDPSIRALCGPCWFALGGSKKEALSRPVDLVNVADGTAWRKRGRSPSPSWMALSLWNGLDAIESVNLDLRLCLGSGVDTLALTDIQYDGLPAPALGERWDLLLRCARSLVRRLGGVSVLGSDALMTWARLAGLDDANFVANGLAWAVQGGEGLEEALVGPPWEPLGELGAVQVVAALNKRLPRAQVHRV